MDEKTNHVSEDTKVAIPIRNLISIIGAVAVSTWAYNGITERLDFLEYRAEYMLEEIEENDSWIDEFEPPKELQENIRRVRELELRIAIAEEKINKHGL